tara:strand:- start:1388 stop:2020 length:633 start_codon:yes stop_codon:yes gene_type:complete
MRNYSNIDKFIIKADEILKTFSIKSSGRSYPAKNLEDNELTKNERELVTNLMRVNHAGEVAAQGLYIGHALASKSSSQREMMLEMASEEKDHLIWCGKRINELGGRTSLFDPIWFVGSIGLGVLSSFTSDRNALGFLEETEIQVAEHLQTHIKRLPKNDKKTKIVLEKMKADEEKHSDTAHESGAEEIPKPIKKIMEYTANIMKEVSFRI